MPDLSFLFVQALNGLASASSLFIIAAGLTIVFGVTRIVNFAHGSFYMLGAYFGVTLIPRLLDVSSSFPMFLAGVLAAALGVGLIGVVMELVLLRRIYKVPELFQLLATFGVVLAVQDLVLKIWGPLDILGPRAPGLRGAVDILGHRFPSYELFLIAMGPLVLGAAVAADAQDALRRAGAGGDAGPRDGGRAGRQPGAAVHRRAVPRRGAGRARRRAADAQARRQPAHGHLRHRRGLRRHRGGRHGLGAGRVPGGAADRRAAGLRHPDLPQDHAGAGVPADGAGAGGAALGPDGPARGGSGPRGAARGHRAAAALRARRAHRRRGGGRDPAGAAARRRRLLDQGGDRGAGLRAGRLQPEFPDRRRRHRQLRPRRLLRARCLRSRAAW